jgi:hypothetical protein
VQMHVRGWVARVLEHEAFAATQALAKTTFKDTDVEVKVRRHSLCLERAKALRETSCREERRQRGVLVAHSLPPLSCLDVCAR